MGTCNNVNQHAACDFKSPKMSNDHDKQSHYGLINALRRTKATFADFSKSPK